MGTPGDKKEISKVVKREIQQPVEQEQQSFPIPTSNLPLQQPIPGTSSEMGVIERQRVSQLESIIGPPLGHPLTGKPVAFQQSLPATIEHYFTQAKYPTSFSQSATVRPKTFLSSVDQPGPSGLQTPKTRPTTASHRLKKTRKPSPEQTPLKKGYTCQICQKDFSTLEKLNKHHQQSHVSSPFKCEHCKKVFSSKFKLVRHALIHSDRKPFCCTVCDRTFHRKDHLKNHIKVHSPQKEVYTCEKENCKKQYTSLLSYRKHLAVHAAEEGNLECQICSEHFDTKEQILYHLKVHAGSRTVKNPSEKKFNCDYCGRKFFTKKDVRRHLVVHTGMRDFLCQFCPQRFGRKDHLVRHIKKSHHAQYKPPEETLTTATIKKEATDATKAEFIPVKTEIKTEHPEYPETSTEFSEASTQFPTSGAAYAEPTAGFPVGAVGQAEVYNPEFGLFFEEGLPAYFEQTDPSLLLPSTSEQVELKDLGGGLFEEEIQVPAPGPPILMPPESIETIEAAPGSLDVVLNDPELLQRLLEPSEDKNLPLPGFSQTFQSPPGPPPQPPPSSS